MHILKLCVKWSLEVEDRVPPPTDATYPWVRVRVGVRIRVRVTVLE